MAEEKRFRGEQLQEYCTALFERTGLNGRDAAVLARSYVENNLRGIDSHGVRLVPNCLRRLEAGGINLNPNFVIESESDSLARINGDNGLGQLVGIEAMERAIGKAKATGVGIVVASNTNNAGAMSTYTRLALERGMAGLCMATTIPSMFAWGGRKRVITNPPISVAFPGRKVSFLLDICLGSVAWNKIHMMRDKGRPIPEGWAWDNTGKITTDPVAAASGGSVIPIGGHKGYGLTLAIELFTGILGGHQFGTQVRGLFGEPSEGEGVSMTVGAVDVFRLLGREQLFDRVEVLYNLIKSSPLMKGFSEVLIPGEPEARQETLRGKEGIPLPEEVIEALKACGRRLNVPSSFGD